MAEADPNSSGSPLAPTPPPAVAAKSSKGDDDSAAAPPLTFAPTINEDGGDSDKPANERSASVAKMSGIDSDRPGVVIVPVPGPLGPPAPDTGVTYNGELVASVRAESRKSFSRSVYAAAEDGADWTESTDTSEEMDERRRECGSYTCTCPCPCPRPAWPCTWRSPPPNAENVPESGSGNTPGPGGCGGGVGDGVAAGKREPPPAANGGGAGRDCGSIGMLPIPMAPIPELIPDTVQSGGGDARAPPRFPPPNRAPPPPPPPGVDAAADMDMGMDTATTGAMALGGMYGCTGDGVRANPLTGTP